MTEKERQQKLEELRRQIKELEKASPEKKKSKKTESDKETDKTAKRKVGKGSRKISDRTRIKVKSEAGPKFKMITEIKNSPLLLTICMLWKKLKVFPLG